MKTIILTVVLGIAAIGLAACGQPTGNGSTAMNHNGMVMNGNMTANQNAMPMNSNSNMPGMTDHSNMMSSPNAASQPYDLQFIDTMSMHHQGAVQMADMVLKASANPELKTFAGKIAGDQKKEIAQMKEWRDKWYAGKPVAINMEMSGMPESMKMMSGGGMMKMQSAAGKDFDLIFLDMMTPHHEGAIVMSKEALTKAEHPEIKTLANQIIKAQEAEIKQMADWKAKWSK